MTSNTDLKTIIDKARVARLAIVDSECRPYLVPVVFAFDGKDYYISIDKKAKHSKPEILKRIKNIQANPNVALLIDEYDEDWTKLYFVMIQGRASLISNKKERQEQNELPLLLLEKAHKLLYEKYPQYQKISIGQYVIMIHPQKVITWKNELIND
ncbi:MAG TPA: TIGR03668 family PPOX class F420-dependent oxidoreductase [Nitrososphaeraceae archaeon]|nr:TIGR03668 family PPOX class F420-dependent oxidoreductase [Nitrososphaeraceae archaeon]